MKFSNDSNAFIFLNREYKLFRLRTVDDLKQYINNILSVTKMKKMRLKDRLIAIKHFYRAVENK